MWIIFYVLYAIFSYYTNFNFIYSNVYEFFIGTLITASTLYGLDKLIYSFAYKYTGSMSATFECDKYEMKLIHWFIRAGLLFLVFVISLTPIPSAILSPHVHNASIRFMDWLSINVQSISDDILKILQNK